MDAGLRLRERWVGKGRQSEHRLLRDGASASFPRRPGLQPPTHDAGGGSRVPETPGGLADVPHALCNSLCRNARLPPEWRQSVIPILAAVAAVGALSRPDRMETAMMDSARHFLASLSPEQAAK